MDDFFVRNRLSAYLDGDLPAAEARAVEAALARDPALRREYEELRRAVDLLRTHGPLTAPAGFEVRLGQRLADEPMPVGWRRWTRAVRPEVIALGALAAAALLYVGFAPDGGEGPVAEVGVPVPVGPAPSGGEEAADEDGDEGAVALVEPEKPAGVQGDEGFAAAQRDAERKRAAGPPPGAVVVGSASGKGGAKGVDREPYTPDWDVEDGFTVIRGDRIVQEGKPDAAAGGGAQKQAPATTTAPKPTSSKAVAQASQPAATGSSYRYRVRSEDETMLSQLASIVASLGGRLVDAQGHALVIHMLETGEVYPVRVVLPAAKVETLAAKLRTLGDAEMMAAGAAGATGDASVLVELERD